MYIIKRKKKITFYLNKVILYIMYFKYIIGNNTHNLLAMNRIITFLLLLSSYYNSYSNNIIAESNSNIITSTGEPVQIIARAKGRSGEEVMKIKVNDITILTKTLSTEYEEYSVTTTLAGNVTLHLTNDGIASTGIGRDVIVDYLSVDGDVRYADNQLTNTGHHQVKEGCGTRSFKSVVYCNGYIQFGFTHIPYGKTIYLRQSGGYKHLLTAERDEQGYPLIGKDNTYADSWEKFLVVKHPEGGVALMSYMNNYYLTVSGNTISAASENALDNSTSFEWIQMNENYNQVALRSKSTAKYLDSPWNQSPSNTYVRYYEPAGWQNFVWGDISQYAITERLNIVSLEQESEEEDTEVDTEFNYEVSFVGDSPQSTYYTDTLYKVDINYSSDIDQVLILRVLEGGIWQFSRYKNITAGTNVNKSIYFTIPSTYDLGDTYEIQVRLREGNQGTIHADSPRESFTLLEKVTEPEDTASNDYDEYVRFRISGDDVDVPVIRGQKQSLVVRYTSNTTQTLYVDLIDTDNNAIIARELVSVTPGENESKTVEVDVPYNTEVGDNYEFKASLGIYSARVNASVRAPIDEETVSFVTPSSRVTTDPDTLLSFEISYIANENRDIVLELFDSNSSQVINSVQTSVTPTEGETIILNIRVPQDIEAHSNYIFNTYLRNVSYNINTTNVISLDATINSPEPSIIEDVKFLNTNDGIQLTTNTTTNIAVSYTATEQRSLTLRLINTENPTNIIVNESLQVSQGNGTKLFNVTIPENTDAHENYLLTIFLMNQDNSDEVIATDAIETTIIKEVVILDEQVSINSINGNSGSVTLVKGDSVNITTSYTTNSNNNLRLLLIDKDTNTTVLSEEMMVNSGSGDKIFTVTIPENISAHSNYEFSLLSVDSQSNNVLAIDSIANNTIEDLPIMEQVDFEDLSSDNSPVLVTKGDEFNIKASYTVADQRSIILSMIDKNDNDKVIVNQSVLVNEGSGSKIFKINIPQDIETHDNYEFVLSLLNPNSNQIITSSQADVSVQDPIIIETVDFGSVNTINLNAGQTISVSTNYVTATSRSLVIQLWDNTTNSIVVSDAINVNGSGNYNFDITAPENVVPHENYELRLYLNEVKTNNVVSNVDTIVVNIGQKSETVDFKSTQRIVTLQGSSIKIPVLYSNVTSTRDIVLQFWDQKTKKSLFTETLTTSSYSNEVVFDVYIPETYAAHELYEFQVSIREVGGNNNSVINRGSKLPVTINQPDAVEVVNFLTDQQAAYIELQQEQINPIEVIYTANEERQLTLILFKASSTGSLTDLTSETINVVPAENGTAVIDLRVLEEHGDGSNYFLSLSMEDSDGVLINSADDRNARIIPIEKDFVSFTNMNYEREVNFDYFVSFTFKTLQDNRIIRYSMLKNGVTLTQKDRFIENATNNEVGLNDIELNLIREPEPGLDYEFKIQVLDNDTREVIDEDYVKGIKLFIPVEATPVPLINKAKIHPNPVVNPEALVLNLDLTKSSDVTVEVIGMINNVVSSKHIGVYTPGSHTIPLASLVYEGMASRGLYFVKITTVRVYNEDEVDEGEPNDAEQFKGEMNQYVERLIRN